MTEAILKIKNLKNIKIEKLNIIMLLSVVALTVFYLFIANNVVMTSYRKTILEKNTKDLKIEIRNLNLELVQKRSIGFIKKAAGGLNLVVNDVIQYIKIVGPVAKNP